MTARIVDGNDPAAIEEAAAILRAGGLCAFPTETVYGLGALALDEHAVRRIFAAKGRPASHPLIVHVLDSDGAEPLCASWPPAATELTARFWPGPLTLVLPRAGIVPDVVTGGGHTVAVRAPRHPVARALLAAVGAPLAAPSANRYQQLSPTTAAHVAASLGDEVALILDGGPCSAGIESTVLDLASQPPRVLRPGAVSLSSLRTILPDLIVADATPEPDAPHPSPGLDPRHYAPRARLVVVERPALHPALHAALRTAPGRTGLVLRAPLGGDRDGSAVPTELLPDDPDGYAHGLYAALHRLDDLCSLILVESVPDGEAWLAVSDRLRRAGS